MKRRSFLKGFLRGSLALLSLPLLAKADCGEKEPVTLPPTIQGDAMAKSELSSTSSTGFTLNDDFLRVYVKAVKSWGSGRLSIVRSEIEVREARKERLRLYKRAPSNGLAKVKRSGQVAPPFGGRS